MNEIIESKIIGENILLKIKTGDLSWDSEEVQMYLPVCLALVDFDWLRLIAENTSIAEDEVIIKNFLAKCESLLKVNSQALHEHFENSIKGGE